jgi:hypothetical protein
MGIGTITLNLLFAKLVGGMIMAYNSLKELAVGSILGAGIWRAFLVTYVMSWWDSCPKMQRVQFPRPA